MKLLKIATIFSLSYLLTFTAQASSLQVGENIISQHNQEQASQEALVFPGSPSGKLNGDKQAPQKIRYKGTGLFVSGGILGVAGLTLDIVGGATLPGCGGDIHGFYCGGVPYFFFALGFSSNALASGLLGGGGHLRGKFEANRDFTENGLGRPRRSINFLASGATLMGLSLISMIVTTPVSVTACGYGNTPAALRCQRRGDTAMGVVWAIAPTMFSIGSGLLGYGVSYRKHLLTKQRLSSLRLSPAMSSQFLGISLRGRF